MLVFYALEDRDRRFILLFAGACLSASAYGFLQGAWPFGVVEAIWSAVAVRLQRLRRNHDKLQITILRPREMSGNWQWVLSKAVIPSKNYPSIVRAETPPNQSCN